MGDRSKLMLLTSFPSCVTALHLLESSDIHIAFWLLSSDDKKSLDEYTLIRPLFLCDFFMFALLLCIIMNTESFRNRKNLCFPLLSLSLPPLFKLSLLIFHPVFGFSLMMFTFWWDGLRMNSSDCLKRVVGTFPLLLPWNMRRGVNENSNVGKGWSYQKREEQESRETWVAQMTVMIMNMDDSPSNGISCWTCLSWS